MYSIPEAIRALREYLDTVEAAPDDFTPESFQVDVQEVLKKQYADLIKEAYRLIEAKCTREELHFVLEQIHDLGGEAETIRLWYAWDFFAD